MKRIPLLAIFKVITSAQLHFPSSSSISITSFSGIRGLLLSVSLCKASLARSVTENANTFQNNISWWVSCQWIQSMRPVRVKSSSGEDGGGAAVLDVRVCHKADTFMIMTRFSVKTPKDHFLHTYCTRWLLIPFPISLCSHAIGGGDSGCAQCLISFSHRTCWTKSHNAPPSECILTYSTC